MIYADTPEEVQKRRKAFLRKWQLRYPPSPTALEEALFTFTTLPPSQWKSPRTTNAIERLHVEFKRRIKTQILPRPPKQLPCRSGRFLATGKVGTSALSAGVTIETPVES